MNYDHITRKISLLSVIAAIALQSVTLFAQDHMTVKMTFPQDKSTFKPCTNILLQAEATITDGRIKDVTFYKNGSVIGKKRTAPFEFNWENVTGGNYYLHAVVTDVNNNALASDSIFIKVGNSPDNNIIINGGFDCVKTPWQTGGQGDVSWTFEIWNDGWFNDSSYAAIFIARGDVVDWYIQLLQRVVLKAGYTYEVTFLADAEKEKTIGINFQQNGRDYAVHWQQNFVIDHAGLYGPFSYEATESDNTNQFKFLLGGNDISIYLDEVTITERLTADVQSENRHSSSSPDNFMLQQNYPNPFNLSTSIAYFVSEEADVRVHVFNVKGQKIRTLVDQRQPSGAYCTTWDGTDESGSGVGSGVYACRLTAHNSRSDIVLTNKMILIK